MSDWSLTGKHIQLYGDPILVDGSPFDPGIKTGGVKSIALRLNRPTSTRVNDEYIQVLSEGTTSLQIAGTSVGKSYFIRFKIYDLSLQEGLERTLFEKIDGSSIEDAVQLVVSTDGKLKFHVTRSGVEHNKETAAATIAVDTVYDVWVTYDQASGTQHIYVNNIDKTLSNSNAPFWQTDTGNTDLWIGQRGKGDDAEGFFYGDLYDFRIYNELVVSAAQVGYMWTNKWTIANLPFGQVMISNYWATYTETESISSFTSTSFTSTSFTT